MQWRAPVRIGLAAAVVLTVGCSNGAPQSASGAGSAPPAPPSPPAASAPTATPTATPTMVATTGSATAPGWVGQWTSDSCGDRGYRRRLHLTDDGKVNGRDWVSPCPPKVACAWSGIVDWSGTYVMRNNRISLSVTPSSALKGKVLMPDTLLWNVERHSVTEAGEGAGCVYRPPER